MTTLVVCCIAAVVLAAVAFWDVLLERRLERSICPVCGDPCDGLGVVYAPGAPCNVELACERCETILNRKMA
jgi:hypothetical protein